MAAFHGIQVYEILENGNLLNAIYTNSGLLKQVSYEIDNEIARKKQYDSKGVEGIYNCRYIQSGNASVVTCELEIVRRNEVFEFKWSENGNQIFQGLGLMSGAKHISVSYIEP